MEYFYDMKDKNDLILLNAYFEDKIEFVLDDPVQNCFGDIWIKRIDEVMVNINDDFNFEINDDEDDETQDVAWIIINHYKFDEKWELVEIDGGWYVVFNATEMNNVDKINKKIEFIYDLINN